MTSVQVMEVAGTDLTVVNAAKVSFAKYKTDFDESDELSLIHI